MVRRSRDVASRSVSEIREALAVRYRKNIERYGERVDVDGGCFVNPAVKRLAAINTDDDFLEAGFVLRRFDSTLTGRQYRVSISSIVEESPTSTN